MFNPAPALVPNFRALPIKLSTFNSAFYFENFSLLLFYLINILLVTNETISNLCSSGRISEVT